MPPEAIPIDARNPAAAAAARPGDGPAPRRVTVYSPNSGAGSNPWLEMWRELYNSRELTWRLFLRDFSARYRQSALGYVWAVAPALITAATFTYLDRTRVLPIGETPLPYPLYVLLGTAVWQLFAGGLTGATQSLVSAGSLITKINFPRETLVLSAFGLALFDMGVRALVVAAAFALYGVAPAWGGLLLLPLCLLPLCLLTLGLGFLLALANGVLRDTGQIIAFVLTFWMFLTPVVYPAPSGDAGGTHSLINLLNPVSPFVIAAHDLTGRGYLTQPGGYAAGCAVALAVFLLGWRVFHLAETRIAERV